MLPCLGVGVATLPSAGHHHVAEQIVGSLGSELLARARQLLVWSLGSACQATTLPVLWAPERDVPGDVPGNVQGNVRHFGWLRLAPFGWK